MAVKRKRNGRVLSMPAGVALGVGTGYFVTLLGAGILAWLMVTQRVGEERIGIGSGVILMVSAVLGSTVAWRGVRHRRLPVTGLTCLGYYLALLVTALAFGGGFTGMGTTAVLVLLGGGITQIPALFGGGSGARRRRMRAFR